MGAFQVLLELTDAATNTATVQVWEEGHANYKKFWNFTTLAWVATESADTKQLINTPEAGQSFSTLIDVSAGLTDVTQLRIVIYDVSGVDTIVTTYFMVDTDSNEIARDLDMPRYIQWVVKCIRNKKKAIKDGVVWYLVVYDDDDVTEIMRKAIKDPSEFNITDIPAGVSAVELPSTVTVI